MEAEEIVKYVGGHDEYCLSDCDCVEIVKKALLEAANGAYEDAAKSLEEDGWNDTLPREVNMKEVAYRYARFIRQKIRRGE